MKRRRTELDWSQERLALELGWTQPTIHEIERDSRPRRIKLDEAEAIASALRLPLEAMLGLNTQAMSQEDLIVERDRLRTQVIADRAALRDLIGQLAELTHLRDITESRLQLDGVRIFQIDQILDPGSTERNQGYDADVDLIPMTATTEDEPHGEHQKAR